MDTNERDSTLLIGAHDQRSLAAKKKGARFTRTPLFAS
jgi:hypothetical protein